MSDEMIDLGLPMHLDPFCAWRFNNPNVNLSRLPNVTEKDLDRRDRYMNLFFRLKKFLKSIDK